MKKIYTCIIFLATICHAEEQGQLGTTSTGKSVITIVIPEQIIIPQVFSNSDDTISTNDDSELKTESINNVKVYFPSEE